MIKNNLVMVILTIGFPAISYFHDHAQRAISTVLAGHRLKNPTESCDPDKRMKNKHSAQ